MVLNIAQFQDLPNQDISSWFNGVSSGRSSGWVPLWLVYAIAAIVENPKAAPIPAELDKVTSTAPALEKSYWKQFALTID